MERQINTNKLVFGESGEREDEVGAICISIPPPWHFFQSLTNVRDRIEEIESKKKKEHVYKIKQIRDRIF